ncbi:membrane protein [Amycolatopsis sp. NBRC 101858]|uniref:Rv1733c family protein n=1 Tax=Amycolatopsis sp. NBRC 101858 TaxID=3032200 RepID=UPI0024A187CF|nr:hypothetical protein [Amycolatopsis sp. NBRC 101858]GLY38155.1 membrane protein [Amycolatopsis sp. NBRC 101858]
MYTRIRLTRLWHSLRPGHESPARPSDRLQAKVLACVLLLSFVAAVGAVLLGIGVYAAELAKSREQTATRYTVTAVLLADGPRPAEAGRGGTPFTTGPARATWWTREGEQRVGDVEVAAGAVAGQEATAWLDETGTPVGRPLTPAAAIIGAPLAATVLWTAVACVLALAYRGFAYVLDRFRFAAWQREWFALQTRRDDQSPAGS